MRALQNTNLTCKKTLKFVNFYRAITIALVSGIYYTAICTKYPSAYHLRQTRSYHREKGSDVDKAKYGVSAIIKHPVHLTVEEEKKPDLSAKILSESVASQLERRVAFRKAMKRAVQSAMRAGAKGVKIMVSGRLNGAEIARSEKYLEGQLPLHTFRANIDYYIATASTTYGIIGVKVWIYKDDVVNKQKTKGEV